MNYAIAGNGTLDHLVCEHLRASAGLDMVKINYQGVPKGITALIAGEVQLMVASVTSAASYVRSGQLKALAVTSAQRVPQLGEAPTMAELGYSNFVMYGWSMLFAPSGVPADIVGKLHDETAKVVARPDVTKIIADTGSEVQSPEPRRAARLRAQGSGAFLRHREGQRHARRLTYSMRRGRGGSVSAGMFRELIARTSIDLKSRAIPAIATAPALGKDLGPSRPGSFNFALTVKENVSTRKGRPQHPALPEAIGSLATVRHILGRGRRPGLRRAARGIRDGGIRRQIWHRRACRIPAILEGGLRPPSGLIALAGGLVGGLIDIGRVAR
jgi:hypothetical protein